MTYRNLGRTGVQVSPICLGAMNFGGPTSKRIRSASLTPRSTAASTSSTPPTCITRARASIVGQALKQNGRRDQVVLATKANGVMGLGPNDQGNSRYHLMRACEIHCADSELTTLTCTRSTAHRWKSRRMKRCGRWTIWCARGKCATSAARPTQPGW